MLEVLTRYVRNQFTDPAPGAAAVARLKAKQRSTSAVKGRLSQAVKRRVVKKAFYSDEEDWSEEETVEIKAASGLDGVEAGKDGAVDNDADLDADHKLVLKSSLPLLKSRNSGVVLKPLPPIL